MARIFAGAKMNKQYVRHGFSALIGLAGSTAVFFVMLVGWQTLGPQDPPIKFDSGVAVAYQKGDDTIVTYTRDIEAEASTQFSLERTISCDYETGKYVYDLPTMYRRLERGQHTHVTRVISFPIVLPIGTKCSLETALTWSPVFSTNWQYRSLPDIDFLVGIKP